MLEARARYPVFSSSVGDCQISSQSAKRLDDQVTTYVRHVVAHVVLERDEDSPIPINVFPKL